MTGPATDPGAARSVLVIARRAVRDRLRDRRVLAGTGALAVLLATVLTLHAVAFTGPGPLRVGLTGQAIGLMDELPADAATLGVTITTSQVPDPGTGTAQLAAGDLDVLVSGSRAALHVTVEQQLDPTLRATLNALVRQQVLDAQIAQLGLKPSDVLGRVNQAQISVTQLRAADPGRAGAVGVALVTATLLAAALALAGAVAARGVADDKRHRTAEALLTAVRPRRLLFGDLAGVGTVGAVQVVALGVLGIVLSLFTGLTGAVGRELVAVGSGLLWFVVGFALYGTAMAAAAALTVTRAELRSVLWAGGAGVVVAYALGVALLAADPGGVGTAVLSVLPPFAPIIMPGRMIVGAANGWQVLVALVLALAAAAALAWLGGRAYAAGMPRTARRTTLRDALG